MKNQKITARKIGSWIGIGLMCLIIFMFILGVILELAIPNSDLAIWIKEYMFDVTSVPEMLVKHSKTFIRSIILIVVVFAIAKLLRLVFSRIIRKSNKAKTMFTLLDGLIKYGSAIVLIFLVLQAFGVNTSAIWESVGILTLIVGLGAQSLIADIIAGIFIIFEDEYSVGEIVSIDDFRGTVTEIGIRATKVLDMAGNIKIINNSDIKNVVNLSRELSLAIVDCEFPYDVPLEFIEKLLKDNLGRFKEVIPGIVEGPFYKGVSGYGSSNVAVKIVAKCAEEDRYQVQRDLLREYRQLFVENGIDLSFEQVVISQATKSDIKTNKKIKREAEEFFESQKEKSKGLEEQIRD